MGALRPPKMTAAQWTIVQELLAIWKQKPTQVNGVVEYIYCHHPTHYHSILDVLPQDANVLIEYLQERANEEAEKRAVRISSKNRAKRNVADDDAPVKKGVNGLQVVKGARYERPGDVRPPVSERAGTVLSHQGLIHLTDGRGKSAGTIDPRQRVYQHGGERKRFVLWKDQAITFPGEAWNDIRSQVDVLEMIDHERNQCFVCRRIDADMYGHFYQDRVLGHRFAVPLAYWVVVDRDETIIGRGDEAA